MEVYGHAEEIRGKRAARHRQEKRKATRLGNFVVIAHGSDFFAKRHSLVYYSGRVEEILVRTRDGPRPA